MADNGNILSKEEFSKMNSDERILKMASGLVPPKGRPKEEILNQLLDKIEAETPTRKIPLIRYFQAAAAIAIILMVIEVVPGLLFAQQVKTACAEQQELTLPDGSTVNLNAGSKLKWNKKKFGEERFLTLSGEAFFDVQKGDDFVIKTKNGTVEILGTQLNVYSRNDNFWVSCLEGKVLVRHKDQQQVITPGEKVSLNQNRLNLSTSEDIEHTASWKEGYYHFEETTLDVIFAEIERQFDVSIKFEGNNKREATIVFSTDDLNEALDVVCIPMELMYEVKNNKIIISEKK